MPVETHANGPVLREACDPQPEYMYAVNENPRDRKIRDLYVSLFSLTSQIVDGKHMPTRTQLHVAISALLEANDLLPEHVARLAPKEADRMIAKVLQPIDGREPMPVPGEPTDPDRVSRVANLRAGIAAAKLAKDRHLADRLQQRLDQED